MIFTETPTPGAFLIDLEKRGDERGFFARTFCEKEFAACGLVTRFVQVNNSLSAQKGTLRGMHYQLAPDGRNKDRSLHSRIALRCHPRSAIEVRRLSVRASVPSLPPRTGG